MERSKSRINFKKEQNINILEAFIRVFEDKENLRKFSKLNEFEDMYKFCIMLKGGYTFDEFLEFLEGIINSLPISSISQKKGGLVPLDDSDDDLVAGGANGFQRFLASSLAVTSLMAGGSSRSYAANFGGNGNTAPVSTSQSQKVEEKTEAEDTVKKELEEDKELAEIFQSGDISEIAAKLDELPKEKKEKTAGVLKKLWNYVWGHKKQIVIGGVAITATIVLSVFVGLFIKDYRSKKRVEKARSNLFNNTEKNDFDAVLKAKVDGKELSQSEKRSLAAKQAKLVEGKIKRLERQKKEELKQGQNEFSQEKDLTAAYGEYEKLVVYASDNIGDNIGETEVNEHISNNYSAWKQRRENDVDGYFEAVSKKIPEEKGWKDKIFDKIPLGGSILTIGSAIIGLGGTAFSTVEKVLETVSKNMGRVKKVTDTVQDFAGMYDRAVYNAQVWSEQIADQPKSKDEVMAEVDKKLSTIYGQEEHLKRVRGTVENFLRQEELAEATGGRRKPQALLVSGTSGCGKSLCCERVGEAVASPGCSLVVNASTQLFGSAEEMKSQLFGKKRLSSFNMFSTDAPEENLSEILSNHPNARVVVTINEIDKMVKDGKNCIEPFLEVMREILDNGYVTVHGKKIQCENVLWLLTANLSQKSLETAITSKGSEVIDGRAKDDPSGSLKDLKLDASILNRMKLIYFNDLTPEAFARMAENRLKKSVEYFGSEEGGSLKFQMAPDMYKKIGAYSITRRSQGRIIDKLQDRFNNQVGELRDKLKNKGLNTNGLTLLCDFDSSNEDNNEEVNFKISVKVGKKS